jgi:hypothetical protein
MKNLDSQLIWEAYSNKDHPISFEVLSEKGLLKKIAPYALAGASMLGLHGKANASEPERKQYGIEMSHLTQSGGANIKDFQKATEPTELGKELPATFVQTKEIHLEQILQKGTQQADIRNLVINAIKTTQLDNGLVTILFEVYGEVTASSQEEANKIAMEMIQKELSKDKAQESPMQIKVHAENAQKQFKVKVALEATYRK